MDNAKQHWEILQKLGNDLENRVREFLVIGRDQKGVIVATEDGQGYWLGTMKFTSWFTSSKSKTAYKPTRLKVPGLVHMAQSHYHVLLLNKRGEIYSMGRNDKGQLGLGTVDEETHLSPQLIPISHKFTSVRCGGRHSLALTEDGKAWAWGSNDNCQVGVPRSTRILLSPHQISELDPYRVVAVECGDAHSLALTNKGEVYSWGGNDCGQLGFESETFVNIPTRIPTPSLVKSMAGGSVHTLLLTYTREVFACGGNEHGQLGLPRIRIGYTTKSSPQLSKVVGLPLISQIGSHFATSLSIAMSSNQQCFVWGALQNGESISTPQNLPSHYSTVDSPLSSFNYYRNTPHSVTLSENPLSRMFDNSETSDVQFVVEQRTIHAHRCILSNSSDYFARMFSERWQAPVDPEDQIVRVTIPDYSYQVFLAFLHFLYTDSFEPYFELLPELFDLACQYLEFDLLQLCVSRMRSTLTPTTFWSYYQLIHRHSMPELSVFQQELVQYISSNFLQVISTPVYQSMDAELCKKLTLSMANHSP